MKNHHFPTVFLWFSYSFPMVFHHSLEKNPKNCQASYSSCRRTELLEPFVRAVALELKPQWKVGIRHDDIGKL
jgi:hypothetical protein